MNPIKLPVCRGDGSQSGSVILTPEAVDAIAKAVAVKDDSCSKPS